MHLINIFQFHNLIIPLYEFFHNSLSIVLQYSLDTFYTSHKRSFTDFCKCKFRVTNQNYNNRRMKVKIPSTHSSNTISRFTIKVPCHKSHFAANNVTPIPSQFTVHPGKQLPSRRQQTPNPLAANNRNT